MCCHTQNLLNRNLGSHITYTNDRVVGYFQKICISFKVSIDEFLSGYKHVIGLNACHLKSKIFENIIINKYTYGKFELYTLAFVVVEIESMITQQWFLENLVKSVHFDINKIIFFFDMEKGLGKEIKQVFLDAKHIVCPKHLWKNLNKTLSLL